MEELSEENFEGKISEGKVIVDFWAPWCGPCKVLGPNFESASEEYDDIGFFKVNVDDQAGIAQEYGVRSIPTLIFFEDGEAKDRAMGAMKEDQIHQKVEEVFG